MAVFECSLCHGVFQDPQGDGASYYHRCPPLSIVELMALSPAEAHRRMPGLPDPFTAADVEQVLSRRVVEREPHRDENIVPGYQNPPGRPGEEIDIPPAPIIADHGERIER